MRNFLREELLHQMVSMIIGLIRSNSDRVHEPNAEYIESGTES
jgi:hypothetical protein